jgi:ADP-dependent NAD(P)H-hydrate dehydratase / NAD(P)H-hydrate epimerase
MENAGSAVARFVLSEYPKAERVGIVAAKATTAETDSLWLAGWSKRGAPCAFFCCAIRKNFAGMRRRCFRNGEVVAFRECRALDCARSERLDSPDAAEIFSADVMVDAILGTGFRPPVSPLYAAAIARMNAAPAPGVIIAVDIPSGADADAMQPTGSGAADKARADAVVTFTAPRPAHVFAALVNKAVGLP